MIKRHRFLRPLLTVDTESVNTMTDEMTVFLAVVIGLLVLLLLVVRAFVCFSKFSQNLRLINMEIRRTEGSERLRWKRRKKRLLLSLLPFARYR